MNSSKAQTASPTSVQEPLDENTEAGTGIDPPNREERIRQAAHRRYEARGNNEGGHQERDWLDAEEEVDGEERGEALSPGSSEGTG